MKSIGIFLIFLFFSVTVSAPASAACFPVKTEIVSLGEKSARSYAERSLTQHIENEKQMIASTGAEIGRIAKGEMSCKPFPNLLGADEWRCVGEASVCTKGCTAGSCK